MFNNN